MKLKYIAKLLEELRETRTDIKRHEDELERLYRKKAEISRTIQHTLKGRDDQ